MLKKAYFFVNGQLLKRSYENKDNDKLDFDFKYDYEIYNFGVSKNFDSCKYGALNDVITDTNGNRKIIPNTYIAILEIELKENDYNSIDDNTLLADFDILRKIKNSISKLVYSGMFDNKESFIENFIEMK